MNNNRIRGMKKICKMLAILMTANLISACGPFIENPVDDMDVAVTGITITGPSIHGDVGSMAIGSTLQLTVTVAPANATDPSVIFISDNNDVATVTVDGIVTAVGEGTVTITVKSINNAEIGQTITLTVADEILGVNDAIDQAEAEIRKRK